MAVVTIWFPFFRFSSTAAEMAQLSPSVPQEVKKSSWGRHPKALAMTARSASRRWTASLPIGYREEGLPKPAVMASAAAWTASGQTGVVAA